MVEFFLFKVSQFQFMSRQEVVPDVATFMSGEPGYQKGQTEGDLCFKRWFDSGSLAPFLRSLAGEAELVKEAHGTERFFFLTSKWTGSDGVADVSC